MILARYISDARQAFWYIGGMQVETFPVSRGTWTSGIFRFLGISLFPIADGFVDGGQWYDIVVKSVGS